MWVVWCGTHIAKLNGPECCCTLHFSYGASFQHIVARDFFKLNEEQKTFAFVRAILQSVVFSFVLFEGGGWGEEDKVIG
jgi:hypothetical protein